MGKGSSKAPAAPDPQKTAAAEAQYNRVDTYSPSGGGSRYGYTNSAGQFVQGVAPPGMQSAVKSFESPTEEALRKALEPASLSLTQRIIADDVTGLPAAARVGDRGTVAKSIFDRTYSMMQPAIDKGNNRLITNLQARGIPIGGDAFNEAYGAQQRETQDTISRLAMDADVQAGQEQSRQFGLDSAARSNAMSEIVAAMGGGYNPPSNAPNGSAANINYAGMVGDKYRADMSAYQANQQNKTATANTLGGIGGAMLMKSDRRLKTDIRAVGQRGPFTLYEYRYLWDKPGTLRRGYMAQEVLKILPDAVFRFGAGTDWLALDYAMLPEVN